MIEPTYYTGTCSSSTAVYHTDENCDILKTDDPFARSETFLRWHGLDACPDCVSEEAVIDE